MRHARNTHATPTSISRAAGTAGRIDVGVREAAAHGVDEMLALVELAGSEQAARGQAYEWTARTASRLALRWGRTGTAPNPPLQE